MGDTRSARKRKRPARYGEGEDEEDSVVEVGRVLDDEQLAQMVQVAKKHDTKHAFTPSYVGVETQLLRDIKFYQAGRMGTIPDEWMSIINLIDRERHDPELQRHKELSKKVRSKLEDFARISESWIKDYQKQNTKKKTRLE
jgi:hypothetical protein